ncbi:TIR domain-containing protein [Coleofasciculus chthonoplastes]|uniref:TIR domain-containing protein n=1 Tax=Coleofasciculus chthonoplastes TaxID=64178 RepID=UPI0032F665D2
MTQVFDAFISYGRADSKTFAQQLQARLDEAGFNVWFDFNDIPLAVDFQNQIDDGIEKASQFLFIIAPHSVNSPYCLKEIELAVKLNKRIIPLLHVMEISQETWQQRNPNGTESEWEAYKAKGLHESYQNMHPTIRKLNWVYFQEDIDFEKSVVDLINLLHSHRDCVDKHTQLLLQALEWKRNQKQTKYLLVGEEKQQAEAWLKIRFQDEQPPCTPTDLHCEYITESIKNANNLMTQVFLSYTDEDRAMMETIRTRLRREGITVWTNTTDIQTGEEFEEAIKRGIEQADTVIYLLSPDSVKSYFARQELEYALSLNKRIIPVLVRETLSKTIPSSLQNLHYIDLTDNIKEEDYYLDESQLLKILQQDAAYYNEHKILLTKALKWKRQHENSSILLRGYNLHSAETWLKVANKRTQHLPTPLIEEFIDESLRQPPAISLDVFISYSRADADFARKLNDELQLQGKRTWFDQESIASGADFAQEIHGGIKACDNFLFILSPRSVNSPYCAAEVEYAAGLNKRFVTVLYQPVNSEELHPELAKVQWIDFNQNQRDFNVNFGQLVRTLETDREHLHQHTKWSQRAIEWQEKGKNPDLLLRGSELAIAQAWLQETQRQKKKPGVTELQKAYIAKSGGHKRRNRLLLTGAVVSVIGVVTFLWLDARRQATTATLRENAARAQLLLPIEPVEALVRAIKTTGESKSSLFTSQTVLPQVQSSLYDASADARERNILQGHESAVISVAFSPDGNRIASGSWDGTIRLWDREGNPIGQPFKGHEDWVMSVAFSPDGNRIASGSNDGTIRLWRGVNWQDLLEVGCNRLIAHPLLVAPETLLGEDSETIEVAEAAAQTCQNSVWNETQNAQFMVNQGWAIAREGDMDAANAKFQQAQKLAPKINIPTSAQLGWWAAEGWVNQGEKLVKEEKFKEALVAYNKAQTIDPTWKISAESWNTLCLFGSLHKEAAAVMDACEKAVALAPENGEFRVIRGLARALTGNNQGAIEDFQAFIEWADSESYEEEIIKQLQGWIDALKAGKIPFTEEEIEELLR